MVTNISHLAVEIPTCFVLKRVGANVLLPTMETLYGPITTFRGLVTSLPGPARRTALVLAEGGLVPIIAGTSGVYFFVCEWFCYACVR